jgi:hypothetical protein
MELSLDKMSQIRMTVLNSAGQQIESNELQAYEGNNVFTLNANNWASGVYFIEVVELGTSEIVRKKVIKD